MDDTTFWSLIEVGRAKSKGDQEAFLRVLREKLEALPAEEIAAFDAVLHRRLHDAYTWPLWGAAYVICGGCSDDGFEYFRLWLIAQGRGVYEKSIKDPESLASLTIDEPEELEFEMLLYLPGEVYESKTGEEEIPDQGVRHPEEPSGPRWEDDDLESLFPRL